MKFLFVHSHIFKYDSNDNVYSEGQFPYSLLHERYLPYCDEITMAGRSENITNIKNLSLSSGPKVKHYKLPDLSTILSRSKQIKKLERELKILITKTDVLIARMPSDHGYHAIRIAEKMKKPYVVEVVGDVFASLWTHGSIFGKILAPFSYKINRKAIKQAPYLIYVTQSFLQKKYPHNKNALVINASNVELPSTSNNILERRLRKINKIKSKSEIHVGLIGSYSSKYKGIDTAITTITKLVEKGFNCKLFILGSGTNEWLLRLAKNFKIEKHIHFEGNLPGGKPVLDWLDNLDIYIQPSLTEGLPRALIEAMSRGLPCIGSSVGGIPELIEKEFIHTPKSNKELTDRIEKLLNNPQIMERQAIHNFNHAMNYTPEVLNNKRKKFWEKVFEKEFRQK